MINDLAPGTALRPELIDELLKDYGSRDDRMGAGGIFKQLIDAPGVPAFLDQSPI